MQRLKYHNRIAKVVTVCDILDVGILRPICRVFAYRIRFKELKIYKEDGNDQDFAGKADLWGISEVKDGKGLGLGMEDERVDCGA